MTIRLLDCTLRDGAHVNGGNFGYQHIKNITEELSKASLDIIELGFLRNVEYNPDISSYPYIEQAYDALSDSMVCNGVEFALMARADEYDISKLSECTGKIKYIRVAFYYDFLNDAIKFAKAVQGRGYSITLNLINTPGCTVQELNEVIKRANEIEPYALTIVDTFGVLFMNELKEILNEYDTKLNPAIKIGLHVHENLSLSFSLAQGFIDCVGKGRDIIVDGSLMGIGRIPGNLCTEVIADYLNVHYGKSYKLTHILRSIDNDIAPIKESISWGYSPAYFLSAKYGVHRSYSEYLLDKGYKLEMIEALLRCIKPEYSGKFNKNYLESIIDNYR